MLVVGLTGGISTGKSTVAQMLKELGATILNADGMAKRLLFRNGLAFKPVVKCFGKNILLNGRINRRKLAAVVFQDRTKLKKLEGIIHPAVKRSMLKKIKNIQQRSQYKIVVLDVPLLFEAKFDTIVDSVIVVKAKQELQIQRAQKHLGITQEEVKRRMHRQMPLAEKIRRADFIIDNNGTKKQTNKQVKEIWQKLSQKRKK